MSYNRSFTLMRQVFESIRQIGNFVFSGSQVSNGRLLAWLMLVPGQGSERKNATGKALGARDQVCNQEHTTILLVEDDKFVREATCASLGSSGFHVLTSKSADEAMR